MRPYTALLAACLLPVAAPAQNLLIEVGQRNALYVVNADAWVDASPDRLRELLTDYAHLDRLNDSILESEIRETHSATRHTVYTYAEVCVAIFCRALEQVQDVEQRPDGDIVVTILPDRGDFRQGYARWHFQATYAGTRIAFESALEPAFWIPPFVGQLLIKHALWRETQETIEKLEALATRQ